MITVIVERHFKSQKADETEGLLAELSRRIKRQSGYIAGEILQSVKDPSIWTSVSTWAYSDQWHRWEVAEERVELTQKIEEMLVAPEKMSIFQIVG